MLIFQIGKADDLASFWDLLTQKSVRIEPENILGIEKVANNGVKCFLFLFVHIRFFMKVCSVSYATKGQLISKYIFGVFNSPKKCTKTIRLEVP